MYLNQYHSRWVETINAVSSRVVETIESSRVHNFLAEHRGACTLGICLLLLIALGCLLGCYSDPLPTQRKNYSNVCSAQPPRRENPD